MATNVFLKDLAVKKTPGDVELVDALTEQAPILDSMPFIGSNRGEQHIYRKVQDIVGGDVVTKYGTRKSCKTETGLNTAQLNIVAGIIEENWDDIQRYGGWDTFVQDNLPLILTQTGQDVEADIIYNSLRSAAIQYGNAQAGGGASDTNYSIIAVTWQPQQTCGMFDPDFINSGMMFDFEPISGGGTYLKKDAADDDVMTKGTEFHTTIGVLTANERQISTIVNCDIEHDAPTGTRTFPTIEQIGKMLVQCRQNANTRIYMHPDVLAYLGDIYKIQLLRVTNSDNQISSLISAWNGVPIIASYNFLEGTELDVTL